jgi:hypothetical protein
MSEQLLEWMSFKGFGEVQDLPAQLTGDSRAQHLADDLSMLGHIEMTALTTWRIAPPVLAELPGELEEPITAVLCGARTAGVLAKLENACRRTEVEIDVTRQENRPSVVALRAATRQALTDTANRAGVPLQRNAAFTLLSCLPTISAWPRTPCAMVAGRVDKVSRFSRSKLAWVESSLADATNAHAGLFRIKREWDSVTIVKSNDHGCARIDDRAGRLLVAAKCRVARWDAKTHTLSLPLQLYPPALIARSLALCSGGLPAVAQRHLHFSGVTPTLLNVALSITGLRIG